MRPFKFWHLPSLLIKFFRKKADKTRFSEVISFKNAKIKLSRKMAHYDGEPIQVRDEINVRVVPASLNIVIGKKN